MREIKFRCWDVKKECWMFNYQIGDILSMGDCISQTDRYILEQYTGSTDKHDNLIYEGDIIKNPQGDINVVSWDFESWQQSEILGNIHQHAHLLNKSAS